MRGKFRETSIEKLAIALLLTAAESGCTLTDSVLFAREAVTRKAAAVKAAAKVLDLRTFSLPEGDGLGFRELIF